MKKQVQKGFSLVELMVVIAIIAILAAVAIPMYSNYTTRAKLGSDLSALGGVKAEVAEEISNNNGTLTGVDMDNTTNDNLPSGATVTTGVISYPSPQVSGATISLSPTVGSGAVTWACNINGVSSSQAPSNCTTN